MKDEERGPMKKRLKSIAPLLCIIPFILGCFGYRNAGETISNSMYDAFVLYFVNPVSDELNVFIQIARWTAPLATASGIIYIVQRLWKNLSWRINCLSGDCVEVYSDADIEVNMGSDVKVRYMGKEFGGHAESCVIMFESDVDSFGFYEDHKDKLENRKVYIGLNDIEYGLLRSEERDNVVLFDINGSIARQLWKNIALWERAYKEGKSEFTITIIGSGMLAQNIMSSALLLNNFSTEQHIVYNFVSGSRNYENKHSGMNLWNKDEIKFYAPGAPKVFDVLKQSDIVVIADELPVDELQTICVNCATREIFYYSPKRDCLEKYLSFARLVPFGSDEDILTDENIRRGALISTAKELNDAYSRTYGGPSWKKLSGFLKWSNISAADYKDVIVYLSQNEHYDEERLAILEHIRWCRFYTLNYWKYGVTDKKGGKDPENRIHLCLVDYDSLDIIDKEKDRDNIRNDLKSI